MSRVILVTDWFDVLDSYGNPTGEKEFLVSHGINEDTGNIVITSQDHPKDLGAIFDKEILAYVLEEKNS
jgi:hypothetical protein